VSPSTLDTSTQKGRLSTFWNWMAVRGMAQTNVSKGLSRSIRADPAAKAPRRAMGYKPQR